MTWRQSRFLLASWLVMIGILLAPLALGFGSAESLGGQSSISIPRLVILAKNSFVAGAGASILSLLVSVPIALTAMRFMPPRKRMLLLLVAVLPLFVSPTIIAVSAVRLFGPAGILTGLVSNGTETFAVSQQIQGPPPQIPPAPIYTLWGAAFTQAWAFYPLALLGLCAALARNDASAEEAASLHTGPLGVLARISLPLAWGGLAAGVALVFLFSLTELGIPEALRSLPVLVSEIYMQFGVYMDTRLALAASLLLVLFAAIIWTIVAIIMNPTGSSASEPDSATTSTALSTAHSLSARLFAGTSILLGILPAVAIVFILCITATGPEGRVALARLVWSTAHEEFFLTLALSLCVAATTGVTGIVLGCALAEGNPSLLWRFLAATPLMLPAPIFGISIPYLLRRPEDSLPFNLADPLSTLSLSYVPLLVVWTIRYAPIVALLVEAAIRAMPRETRDLARLEGIGPAGLVTRILLPSIWPSAAAGMMAAFAFSLGDVGAPVLLLPPGATTLGVRLFTLMHWAPEGEVSVLSLLMLVPAIIAYAVAVLLLRMTQGTARIKSTKQAET